MFERGKVILVPFPFTDLSSQKIRPALIISKPAAVPDNVIVAFITSKKSESASKNHILLENSKKDFDKTGLKKTSLVRCDKIATLDKQIVLGEIGSLSLSSMKKINLALKNVIGL